MSGPTDRSTLSGLTDGEAREFHSLFITSFIGFTVVAIIAHILVWMWRPWIPGPKGYSLIDGATSVAHHALSMLG